MGAVTDIATSEVTIARAVATNSIVAHSAAPGLCDGVPTAFVTWPGLVRRVLTTALAFCLFALSLTCGGAARAEAGPPYLTNDPGTPGNTNWEINLASMPIVARGVASYQVPQIDLNYGVGDRIQLTIEIPYVLQTVDHHPVHGSWGNAYPGVKWRFIDQGDGGLQMSIFPQVESATSRVARELAIGAPGPRYLLPLEVSKRVGPLDLDFEAGYYVAGHAPRERILGFVAGRSVTSRLELDAEIYDDRADGGGTPRTTTLDVGGRYQLRPGVIALFMVGRSLNGLANGQPEFMGYFGVQLLLSDYGRRFTTEP
jgi:hypothetical protein